MQTRKNVFPTKTGRNSYQYWSKEYAQNPKLWDPKFHICTLHWRSNLIVRAFKCQKRIPTVLIGQSYLKLENTLLFDILMDQK